MSGGPQTRVAQGELLGRAAVTPSGVNYFSFQGVPYARPPVGSLRFKAAEPAQPWEGVRDATAEGNVCAQIQTFPNTSGFIGGEDCLFINVYTPSLEGEFLPVMVWSHAGTFDQGSGNTDLAGPEFLVENDVIVVTYNYRTGPLGFLCLNTPEVPGNAGLKDQVLALQWVKENIGAFGGNSGNITLFGEGAGGASSSYLTLSHLSKDLMSKAIFQSGTSLNSFAIADSPLESAKELAKSLGCDSHDVEEIFLFLQAVSVRELVESAKKLDVKFAPVIEKELPGVEAFMTENPLDILASGRGAKIPIMIGRTTEEAAIDLASNFEIDTDLRNFIPKKFNIDHNSDRALELAAELKKFYFNNGHIGMDSLQGYLKLLGDREYAVDIHRYIQILVKTSNQPVYSYKFAYVGGLNLLKNVLESFGLKSAGHMDELGYLFHVAFLNDADVSPGDAKMRETMVQIWTNFAKTGNPTPEENGHLTVTWLPVSEEHQYYLNIDRELTLSTNADKVRMELWDGWYSKYSKNWETQSSPVKVAIEDNNVEGSPVNAHFESPCDESQDDSGITDEADVESPKAEVSDGLITPEKEEIQSPVEVQDVVTVDEEVVSPKIEITSPLDSPIEEDSSEKEAPKEEGLDTPNKEDYSVKDVPVEKEGLESTNEEGQDSRVNSPQNEVPKEKGLDTHIKEGVPKKVSKEEATIEVKTVDDKVENVDQEEIDAELNNGYKGLRPDVEVINGVGDQKKVLNGVAAEVSKEYVNEKTPETNRTAQKDEDRKDEREVINKVKNIIDEESKTDIPAKRSDVKVSNGAAKDIIRANDPPEDDLPRNIGVNKFVNFFESLGGKK